ncbi:unnamed protein product [Pedinophyceae sp. YPF-701]|nr:unnamed protein product [Pedinophyceae sp. YPF-701]
MGDADKRGEFMELQQKLLQTSHQLRQMERQAVQHSTDMRRAKLIVAEVGPLPDNVIMYKNVGRAYMMEAKGAVIQSYEGKAASAQASIENLKSAADKVQELAKSTKQDMEELLRTYPNLLKAQ